MHLRSTPHLTWFHRPTAFVGGACLLLSCLVAVAAETTPLPLVLRFDMAADPANPARLPDTGPLGYHGTLQNARIVPEGYRGSALRLEGKDSCVTTAGPMLDRLATAISMTLWLKVERAPAAHANWLIGKGPDAGFQIGLGDNRLLFVHAFWGGGWYGTPWQGPIPTNQWVHVALTMAKGDYARLYIDGRERSREPTPCAFWPVPDPFRIGGFDWCGLVDEVRVYAAQLTAEQVRADRDGYTADLGGLPPGLREALPVRGPALRLVTQPPAPKGAAALVRTDPVVEALARSVLDAALDPVLPSRLRPARRAGVMRTAAVRARTTLLLCRFRFHLVLPGAEQERPMVAEEARVLAWRGRPGAIDWLRDEDAEALLGATPSDNVAPEQAAQFLTRALDTLPAVTPVIETTADRLAAELLDSHRRVRRAAAAQRRGLRVTAQKPVDVLGLYVYLPAPEAL